MAARASYVEVGAATRALITAATSADPPLGKGEWRVVAAVIHATSTWSRFHDRILLSDLGAIAHLGKDRLGKNLKSLASRGLIVYEPGRGYRGGGTASLVGLPCLPNDSATGGRPNSSNDSATGGRPNDQNGSAGLDEWVGGNGSMTRPPGADLPRPRYPEKSARTSTNGNGTNPTCPHCGARLVDCRPDRRSDKQPTWKCSNPRCNAGNEGRPWASWDPDPPRVGPLFQAEKLARNRARVPGIDEDQVLEELRDAYGNHLDQSGISAALEVFRAARESRAS